MNKIVRLILGAAGAVAISGAAQQSHASEIVVYGGKCLDVRGAGRANGTRVQMWNCAGVANQRWSFERGKIVGYGGKCLDVRGAGTANGTVVQMWDCAGVNNSNGRSTVARLLVMATNAWMCAVPAGRTARRCRCGTA